MLPKQVTGLIGGFVCAYDSEHPAEKEFRNAHQRFAESLVQRGFGWPTGAFAGIGKSVVQYLEVKARFVWEKLQQVITSTGMEPYPDMNADLKAEIESQLKPSVETANRFLEDLRRGANAPPIATTEIKRPFDTEVLRINAEVDLFCAAYAVQKKQTTASQIVHIGTLHGTVGNITNSQVALNDYSSAQQLLVDQKLPKKDGCGVEVITGDSSRLLRIETLAGEIGYVPKSGQHPSYWKFLLAVYMVPLSQGLLAFPFHKCSAVLAGGNQTISDAFLVMLQAADGRQSSLGRITKTASGRIWRRPNGFYATGAYRPPGGNELKVSGPGQVEIAGNADSDVYSEYPTLHLTVRLKEVVSEKEIVLSHDFVRKEDGSAWVLAK